MTVDDVAGRKARSGRRAMLFPWGLLGVFVLGAFVLAGVLAHSAYDERLLAGRYLAAPECAMNTAPSGDCFAWETQTVSSVDPQKGSTDVYLDGRALDLYYTSVPSFVADLSAGESVPVLVWEGYGQALRDPQGQLYYSQSSALYDGYNNIAGAAVCSAIGLFCAVGMLPITKWFTRQRPLSTLIAILLADVAVAGGAGGAVIQGAHSVGSGLQIGEIVFIALALVEVVAMLLRPRWLRRKIERKATLTA